MAKGDGSITKVKDGVWRVCLSFGNDPITGKRIKEQRIVRGTKAEARKVRDQIRREHEQGLVIGADKITFAEFAAQWHQSRVDSGEIGLTRLKRTKSMANELSRYIGELSLRDITPQVVESLLSKLRADKIEQRGSISGSTLNMYHKLLKQILAKAVDFDLILRNPCDRVKAPKCDSPDRRSLSVEEAQRLLAAIDAEELRAYETLEGKNRRKDYDRTHLQGMSAVSKALAARIALATGMRRGEVVGLTWGSVDLANGRIRVKQAVTVYQEVKEPKSEAGKRVINIDAKTLDHLSAWKVRQREELEKICLDQTDDTPVCCSDTGGYINPHNMTHWWLSFTKANGFNGLKLHELRHTQATQLVANGVDMKTVQRRLGHSTASLTMNLYAHALPENDRTAADMIGSLFSSKPHEANTAQKVPA